RLTELQHTQIDDEQPFSLHHCVTLLILPGNITGCAAPIVVPSGIAFQSDLAGIFPWSMYQNKALMLAPIKDGPPLMNTCLNPAAEGAWPRVAAQVKALRVLSSRPGE